MRPKILSLVCLALLSLISPQMANADGFSLPVNPQPAKPTPPAPLKAIASDTNGLYKLEVLRAAWVNGKQLGADTGTSYYDLTLWVRVTAMPEAITPAAGFTLNDYLLEGRIGEDGKPANEAYIVGQPHFLARGSSPRWKWLEDAEKPVGLGIWRAQNAQTYWPKIRAEWEFLTPGTVSKAEELPSPLLKGYARTSGPLLRFSVLLDAKDIEPLPRAKTVVPPLGELTLNEIKIQSFPPVVVPRKDSPDAASDNGTITVKFPLVMVRGASRDLPNFTIYAPSGQEWNPVSLGFMGLVPRPGGGWPVKGEEVWEVSMILPKNYNLAGDWALQAWLRRSSWRTASPSFTIPLDGSGQFPLPPVAGGWQVVDARLFDARHPLPPGFAPTVEPQGIAVKFRGPAITNEDKFDLTVTSATTDDAPLTLDTRQNISVIGREETIENGEKILYVLWQCILPYDKGPVKQLNLKLQSANRGTPQTQATVNGIKVR